MSASARKLTVNADVFTWLYDVSGCSETEILDKTNLTPKEWSSYLNSEETVTLPLSTIKTLAELYKRPITAFLIAEPPKDNPIPKDFRRAPKTGTYTKDTRKKFLKAQHSLRLFAEMLETAGDTAKPDIPHYTLEDNPHKAAEEERDRLGIDTLKISKNGGEAWKEWRDFITSRKIPVFQYNLDADGLGGFVTKWNDSYGIAVNSGDKAKTRIFTLFHEYAHILLGIDPVCSDDGETSTDSNIEKTERWCDSFAGSLLMPEPIVRNNTKVLQYIETKNYTKAAEELAKTATVSKSAALVRLRVCGLIPITAGASELATWKAAAGKKIKEPEPDEDEDDKEKTPKGKPKIDRSLLKVQELGATYLSLANENYTSGKITYLKYLNTLGITKNAHERLQKKGVL